MATPSQLTLKPLHNSRARLRQRKRVHQTLCGAGKRATNGSAARRSSASETARAIPSRKVLDYECVSLTNLVRRPSSVWRNTTFGRGRQPSTRRAFEQKADTSLLARRGRAGCDALVVGADAFNSLLAAGVEVVMQAGVGVLQPRDARRHLHAAAPKSARAGRASMPARRRPSDTRRSACTPANTAVHAQPQGKRDFNIPRREAQIVVEAPPGMYLQVVALLRNESMGRMTESGCWKPDLLVLPSHRRMNDASPQRVQRVSKIPSLRFPNDSKASSLRTWSSLETGHVESHTDDGH